MKLDTDATAPVPSLVSRRLVGLVVGVTEHLARITSLGEVLTPHGPGDLRFDPGYNGVDRQRLLLLRITMVHMYSVATKQRLYEAIVKRFGEAGVRADDILISVVENGFEDWYAGRL